MKPKPLFIIATLSQLLFCNGANAAQTSSDNQPLNSASGRLQFNEFVTIDDLQKLAFKNNPTLVQAQAQIDGEKAKALQAGLSANPFVGYVGDLMGVPTGGAGEFQGGVVGQDIILGGKLKYSRKKYEARVSAAEQQAIGQKWRVVNDVQIYFLQTLAAQEKLKLQQEMLKSAKDHWLTTNEMFNMGQSNQAALHEANIVLELQKTKVLTSQNELDQAWQDLTTVVGIDVTYRPLKGNLDDVVPDINFDTSLKSLLAESPELGEARFKLKSDEITVQREKRQPIPNVTISGGEGYDQIDRGAATVAAFNITNIPLFNRNQGTIQQAEADLSRQQGQVRLLELTLRRKLADHYNRYKSALQYVQAYKNVIIPESQKKYEICLESYKNTRLEWPEVLQAQREYIEARLDYINHLFECRESSTEIQGFLLTGGLVPPPGVTPSGHIDATPQPR